MLALQNIRSGYDTTEIVHGVTMHIQPGEIHGLFGRNGMGKTTTLLTIAGILSASQGSIIFDGIDITKRKAHEIAQLGIALVPETRDIFGSLSVRENLQLAMYLAPRHVEEDVIWDIQRVLALFPTLVDRLDHAGSALSGGQQQMLAIARALVTQPRLLMLDEPTEGLAPIIVKQLYTTFRILKQSNLSILLVTQNATLAGQFCDYISVMNRGTIVRSISAEHIDDELLQYAIPNC